MSQLWVASRNLNNRRVHDGPRSSPLAFAARGLWFALLFVASACPKAFAQAPFSCKYNFHGRVPVGTVVDVGATTADISCVNATSPTIGVQWGDGVGTSVNSASLVTDHLYPVPGSTRNPTLYFFSASASDSNGGSSQLNQFVSFPSNRQTRSAFAGLPSQVTADAKSVAPNSETPTKTFAVVFVCTTVIDSNGVLYSATALNITCSTTAPTIILGSAPTSVTVTVATSGPASTFARLAPHSRQSYLAWLPIPLFLLLAASRRDRSKGKRRFGSSLAVLAIFAVSLPAVSCGGGFKTPKLALTTTPAGVYQVTIVSQQSPAPPTPDPNFVQTTLIVPLTVGASQ